MGDANNPLEELSELFAMPSSNADAEQGEELRYQLRFGEAELVLEDGTVCKVSLRRAYLGLSLSGLTIAPGSEYGAQLKDNEVSVAYAAKKDLTSTLKGGVSAFVTSLFVPGAEAGVKAEASVTKQSSEETAYTVKKTRMTPRGGQKWEIVEPSQAPLDGDYLAHSVALCRVEAIRGANLKEVTARVFVKQRDLLFRYEADGRVFSTVLSINRQKLLNILIAKALNNQAPVRSHHYTGSLVLSETVSEHEG